jgi:DNA adenine methylase
VLADHVQIAGLLSHKIRQPWIVSYDAAPEVIDLYKDYASLPYSIEYSAQTRYAGAEVIFYSPGLRAPVTPKPAAIRLPVVVPPCRTQ